MPVLPGKKQALPSQVFDKFPEDAPKPAKVPPAAKTPPAAKVPPKNGTPIAAAKPAVPKPQKAAKLVIKSAVDEAPRSVIYPHLIVNGIVIPPESCIITVAKMAKLLGWETEPEYTTRMLKEFPDMKPEAAMYGSDYLLRDVNGYKVRCWNNCRNRPFDEGHAKKLAQDLLQRNWAGFVASELKWYELHKDLASTKDWLGKLNGKGEVQLPEMTINGETIIIGRTGQVESGQHRGVALMLAEQIRLKQKGRWEANWPDEVILESLVVCGVSESPKNIQTLDNVKPRTLADIFYTSPLFNDLEVMERRECSRMLDRAVAFLWKRTGMKQEMYQTHSESQAFVEAHIRILDCLAHIFQENKDRVISNLRLSAGECAGAMYLMGCCKSDGENYHIARKEGRVSEKSLNWETWDDAREFWVMLGKDAKKDGSAPGPITKALTALVDIEDGSTGRAIEKYAILAKAWKLFLAKEEMTVEKLSLSVENGDYIEKSDGTMQLNPDTDLDFGGIDLGPDTGQSSSAGESTDATEDIEAAKKKIRDERYALMQQKTAEKKAQKEAAQQPTVAAKPSLKDELEVLRAKSPGMLLIFKGSTKCTSWGDDAHSLAKVLKVPVQLVSGNPKAEFPLASLEGSLKRLFTAGYKVGLCEQVGKETKVRDASAPGAATKPPLKGGIG